MRIQALCLLLVTASIPALAQEATSSAETQALTAIAPAAGRIDPVARSAPLNIIRIDEKAGVPIVPSQGYAQPIQLSDPLASLNLPAGTTRYTIAGTNVLRSFLLHIPANLPSRPAPLIVALHPKGLSPADHELMTGLSALADQYGFIVAYPEALGETPEWATGTNDTGRAEIQFIQSMLEQISHKTAVLRKAIFVSGMGSGAVMGARLACMLPTTFAAVGLIGGNYPQWSDCVQRPISAIILHGDKDPVYSYNGRALSMGPQGYAERMAKLNACQQGPSAQHQQGDMSATGWSACAAGTEVVLLSFAGLGHAWPGSSAVPAAQTTQSVNASTTMWNFFGTHQQVRWRAPRNAANAQQ